MTTVLEVMYFSFEIHRKKRKKSNFVKIEKRELPYDVLIYKKQKLKMVFVRIIWYILVLSLVNLK